MNDIPDNPFRVSRHLLRGARFLPSPNCGDRPAGVAIDLIVLHNISLPPGEFGTGCIHQLFRNELDPCAHPYFAAIAHLRVSAHLLIDRRGLPTQFVPFHRQAWHAGESAFAGRACCNDYSIGIELEGSDATPFTNAQYDTLGQVIRALLEAYPHTRAERIVGHSDIAPGRKTDPGPHFDWQRLRRALVARPAAVGAGVGDRRSLP